MEKQQDLFTVQSFELNPVKEIVILGEPKPQPRHRHFSRGKFVQTYDPAEKDKESFLSIVQNQAPETPYDCPLYVRISFYFSRPKSHYGTGRNAGKLKGSAPKHHIKKPDIDNLQKFILDSLNKVFWRDDSVICILEGTKEYSDKPRTEIYIQKIL